MKKAGIIIIIIGLAMTVFTAFTFFTREKVADLGDVHISMNKAHNLKWSPVIGIVVMGVGALVLFIPYKK